VSRTNQRGKEAANSKQNGGVGEEPLLIEDREWSGNRERKISQGGPCKSSKVQECQEAVRVRSGVWTKNMKAEFK